MRHVLLTAATLTTLVLAATFSTARADSYYGPIKVNNMCWQKQVGNSLGYWEVCKSKTKMRASSHSSQR